MVPLPRNAFTLLLEAGSQGRDASKLRRPKLNCPVRQKTRHIFEIIIHRKSDRVGQRVFLRVDRDDGKEGRGKKGGQ